MPENTWFRKGPVLARLPLGKEPQTARTIGVPDGEPFGIYISDEAADFIGKYVMADSEREMGGILVGYVAKSGRPFILIRGAIEARDAETVNGGISFTDRSWEYMHGVWEREYPDTLVVGWFCSHPGYGVSVTGYDRFTHHRLFNRPWQVAFVVDPIRNASMFHRWEDDRLTSVENFAVWNTKKEPSTTLIPKNAYANLQAEYETVGENTSTRSCYKAAQNNSMPYTSGANESAATTEEDVKLHNTTFPWLPWALLAIALVTLLWPSFPWSLPHIWSSITDRQHELQQIQQQLKLENPAVTGSPSGTVNPTTPAPSANSEGQPITQNTRSGTDRPDIGVAHTGTRASPPSSGTATSPQADSAEANSILTTKPAPNAPTASYEVKPGDTLWNISKRISGDALAYRKLAEKNGIPDPALIHPGTKLDITSTNP